MENGFKFSSSKTLGMHFCNKRELHPDPELKLYNSPIKIVSETKCLGLFFFIVNLPFYPILKCLKIRALKLLLFYNLCLIPTGCGQHGFIQFIQIVDSIKIGLRMHRISSCLIQSTIKDYDSHLGRSELLQLRFCMLKQTSLPLKTEVSNLVCSMQRN